MWTSHQTTTLSRASGPSATTSTRIRPPGRPPWNTRRGRGRRWRLLAAARAPTPAYRTRTGPREIVPITTVLSNCVHLLVQMGLLFSVLLISGVKVNRQWLWLPLMWVMQIVFVCGMALFFSAINVFVRDTRYVVDSACTVLFWLVPIMYPFEAIPKKYIPLYELNPVAAQVMSLRRILLTAQSPVGATLGKLAAVSVGVFLVGLLVFRRLKPMFYERI